MSDAYSRFAVRWVTSVPNFAGLCTLYLSHTSVFSFHFHIVVFLLFSVYVWFNHRHLLSFSSVLSDNRPLQNGVLAVMRNCGGFVQIFFAFLLPRIKEMFLAFREWLIGPMVAIMVCAMYMVVVTGRIDDSYWIVAPEELTPRIPFVSRIVFKHGVQIALMLLGLSPFGLVAVFSNINRRLGSHVSVVHSAVFVAFCVISVLIKHFCSDGSLFSTHHWLLLPLLYLAGTEAAAVVMADGVQSYCSTQCSYSARYSTMRMNPLGFSLLPFSTESSAVSPSDYLSDDADKSPRLPSPYSDGSAVPTPEIDDRNTDLANYKVQVAGFAVRAFIGLPLLVFTKIKPIPFFALAVFAAYVLRRAMLVRRAALRCLCLLALLVASAVSIRYKLDMGCTENWMFDRFVGSCKRSHIARLERYSGFVDASRCPFTVMFRDRMFDEWGEPTRYLLAESADAFPWNIHTVSLFKNTYALQIPHGYAAVQCVHPFLGFREQVFFVPQTNLKRKKQHKERTKDVTSREESKSKKHRSKSRPKPASDDFSNSQPWDIILWNFDALDRFWFAERMKESYVRFQERPNAHYFNFSGYRAIAANSLPNQMPLFSGAESPAQRDANPQLFPYTGDFYREVGGYSFGFYDEDCGGAPAPRVSYNFPANHSFVLLDEDPRHVHGDGDWMVEQRADATMVAPFCHPGWHPFNDYGMHCLAGSDPYHLRLSFMHDFLDRRLDAHHNRPTDQPKLFIGHVYEAHTRLPQLLDLYDKPFAAALDRLFVDHPRAIIILLSDHGLHYNEWDYSHEFTMLFMSLPLDFPQHLLDTMRENERSGNRFSGHDVSVTLMDLLPPHDWSAKYREKRGKHVLGPAKALTKYKSLLRDVVPNNRTCSDCGIQPQYCRSFDDTYPQSVVRFL
eukprot:ANDGO_06026.mRNA.1 hypothetical protein